MLRRQVEASVEPPVEANFFLAEEAPPLERL
jgi:hypothetical protein